MKPIKTNHHRHGRQSVSGTVCCVIATAIVSLQMCPTVYASGSSQGFSSLLSFADGLLKSARGAAPLQSNTTSRSLGNGGLLTGNDLWDDIIRGCYKKPSTPCFQNKVHSFLDRALNARDVNITGALSFFKNKVTYPDVTTTVSYGSDSHANDLDTEEVPNESRSESAIEEVTSSLHGKAVKFMMTHDVELRLPAILFDNAVLRISPRSFEGNGALVKVELVPSQLIEARDTGRIFKKKIMKFLKNKLLLSFLAVVLVIKLIKIKLFWLLPIIVGIGTAKKLLLKFLLFLFPALSHVFKLCPTWQEAHHETTKFHHHQHQINHHHTVNPPPWLTEQHHAPSSSAFLPNGPELIFTDPPKGNPSDYIHRPGPKPYLSPVIHKPHPPHPPPRPSSGYVSTGWESSGPGLGPEYISDVHRNAITSEDDQYGIKVNEVNGVRPYGVESQIRVPDNNFVTHKVDPFKTAYSVPLNKITANMVQISTHRDPGNQIEQTQAMVKESLRIQAEQKLIEQQQKILQQQPFVRSPEAIRTSVYDPFYSPIVDKMDKIFAIFGTLDDYCKERLVCSMYKTPTKYSPQSNFISAELSRDTSDLQKPSSTNDAAFRFYRYVQAARDGQEQRDCTGLYPQCLIPTD